MVLSRGHVCRQEQSLLTLPHSRMGLRVLTRQVSRVRRSTLPRALRALLHGVHSDRQLAEPQIRAGLAMQNDAQQKHA